MNNNIDLTQEMRLVSQARDGSREAFCSLYGQYKARLYRYALYRLCSPEDAEDAVSECVLAAWQGMPRLSDESAFAAWIFTILSRCCAKRIKEIVDQRKSLPEIYRSDEDPAGGSARMGTDPLLSAEINEALRQLADDEREIVLLSVLGGMSSREISDVTSLTPGSVRSKLSRSLAKMRDFLS